MTNALRLSAVEEFKEHCVEGFLRWLIENLC